MQVLTRMFFTGTFTSAAVEPPAGSKSVTFAVDMDHSEIVYPPTDNNRLRLGVEADFGLGFKPMTLSNSGAWTALWQSGPGAVAPSVTWAWDPTHPPLAIRAVLENRNQANAGLTVAFNS